MKTLVLLLASSALFSGCASPSSETSHTVKVEALFDLDLPYADSSQVPPALVDRTLCYRLVDLSSVQVREVLGRPSERLTPDLWVYWNFQGKDQAADGNGGQDTLVIAFAQDKVSGAKLVKAADLRAALAKRKPAYAQN